MEEIKILVADDKKNTCQLFKEYLTPMGGKVDVAYDGKRALECLDSKSYDLLFLDCNMPELSGIEMARYLKAKRTRPKIVVMTGYAFMDEGFAKAIGADVYLKKPFLLDDVKKVINGR